jgi:transcription initiation factor TFIID subunit 7
MDAPTPGPIGSEAGDAPTPAAERDAEQEGEEDEEAAGGDDDIDEELAAELDLALGDEGEEGDEEDEDEDDDDSDEEDEDEEDEETNQSRRLLNEEIRDLEAAVAKKNHEIAHSANPLIRVRRIETVGGYH